jgi:hypothetical protein
MVTDNVNGQKNGNGTTPEAPDEGINIRLPEPFSTCHFLLVVRC